MYRRHRLLVFSNLLTYRYYKCRSYCLTFPHHTTLFKRIMDTNKKKKKKNPQMYICDVEYVRYVLWTAQYQYHRTRLHTRQNKTSYRIRE